MKNIPHITFEGKEKEQDFELINLTELFGRIPAILSHNPNKPHRISFFTLLMVTKGEGTHQVDLQEYHLESASVLKIAKGQVHAFQKNPKYEGFLIIFTERFVLNYFSKSSINLISHFYNYHVANPLSNDRELNQTLINELNTELESKNTFAKKNIIAALLDLYLLRLERKTDKDQLQNSGSKHYQFFVQFKSRVEANYRSTRNVKDYAQLLFISSKFLNQIVREFTLDTAKVFIDDYVILEAKREIVSTNKSLKEVAYEIGFDELTNFTKFFKKKVNSTPKEFRQKQIS